MGLSTHYDTLGVDYDASAAVIESAYQERARVLRLKHDTAPVSLRESVVAEMYELDAAHAILSDDTRRSGYDALVADRALNSPWPPEIPSAPPQPPSESNRQTWPERTSAFEQPAQKGAHVAPPGLVARVAEVWPRFRKWRWWWQALLWILVAPAVVWMFAASRTRRTARVWWSVAAVVLSLFWISAVANANTSTPSTKQASSRAAQTAPPATLTKSTQANRSVTTHRPPPTTRAKPAPTTTRPAPTTTRRVPTTRPRSVPTTTIPEADRKGDQPNPGALYPGRADIQSKDHEQFVGASPVRFGGYSVWVKSVQYVQSTKAFCCGFVRADVEILNRDQASQDWLQSDFSIVYPTGEVYSPTYSGESELGISGGLVHGGQVSGDVWFSVPPLKHGTYYIYWDSSSDIFDSSRGVWRFAL